VTMATANVRRAILWLSLGALLALVVGNVALSAPSTASQSWFDQPLPSSVHALGPVPITAHSTAPGGINTVELLIDGVSVETLDFAGAPRLVTAEFDWQPVEERSYWLVVRGRAGEEWGPPALILVIIGDPDASPIPSPTVLPSPTGSALPTDTPTASPSPTTAPTATPTAPATASPTARPTASPTARPTASPTARPTPTPTSCTPAAPNLLGPADGYEYTDPDVPLTLSWGYDGACQPTGFQARIEDADGNPVTHKDNLGPSDFDWTPSGPFTDCVPYFWHVRVTRGGANGPWSDTWSFSVRLNVRSCG
jgi:cell division septation protein DedD